MYGVFTFLCFARVVYIQFTIGKIKIKVFYIIELFQFYPSHLLFGWTIHFDYPKGAFLHKLPTLIDYPKFIVALFL
ncbi:hypothetical protein C7S20_15495 [Christiangramia fulva]|uniref:Uncharacterized protein n=1 Tax=Christiangramia fulva TaxID=2126553 RepID=A0A2R3Z8M0_9FLAO|nr:hypothetical protein C7S20_15495 [Christiangramia fulva]